MYVGLNQHVASSTWWPTTDQDLQNLYREASQPASIPRDPRPLRYVSDDLLPELPDDFPTFLVDEPEISSSQNRTQAPSKSEFQAGLHQYELSASTSFSADDMDCSFPVPSSIISPAVPATCDWATGLGPPASPEVYQRSGTAAKSECRSEATAVNIFAEAVSPSRWHGVPTAGTASAVVLARAAAAMSMPGGGKSRPTPPQARAPKHSSHQQRSSVRPSCLICTLSHTVVYLLMSDLHCVNKMHIT